VAITASTGVAALNIHGRTLHSFAGIGLGKEPAEMLLKKVTGFAKKRWINTQVLIIDESWDIFSLANFCDSLMFYCSFHDRWRIV